MTRSLRNLAFLALTGFFATSLAIAPVESAHATTLAPLTIDQMTDASVAIVRGKVTRVWTEESSEGHVWTRAEIAVTDVIKGVGVDSTIIVDSPGGTLGDVTTIVDETARFDTDEDVLLFLDRIRFDTRWTPVAMFKGKYVLRRPADEERLVAIQFTLSTEEVYDGRFLAMPKLAERVYADDLISQINKRLDSGWDGKLIPGASAAELEARNTAERRHR